MMQAIFHALLVATSLIATIFTIMAFPIRANKSAQQRKVERQIPFVLLLTGLATFGALLYGFISDASAEYEISYQDLQSKLRLPGQPVQPVPAATTSFSPLRELRSTFSFANQANGIDCSQIRQVGARSYAIDGTIYIGGTSISRSVISEGVLRVGAYDVGALINEKCGGVFAFHDALKKLP